MYVMYLLNLAFMYGWTYSSLYESSSALVKLYTIANILLVVLGSCVCIGWEKKKSVRKGVVIALSLLVLGASVAFRSGDIAMKGYIKDLVVMVSAFVFVYLLVRFTDFYKIKLINFLIICILPISLLHTRFFGKQINGSHMYFCGFLIFGFILAGYPFAASYFLSLPERRYFKGNVKNLSLNLMAFLLYTLFLFAGCALCNEFGLLLVLAITATGLFYVTCRNLLTKLFYSAASVAGAIIACRAIPHVRDRVIIWLNPSVAAESSQALATKAETVLYLFRNFRTMGWYGLGIGNLPESIYRTHNSDHLLVTLLNDYGLIFAILTLGMGALLIGWLFQDIPGLDCYDRFLLLSGGLIVSLIIAIHVGSCLASFITAGIPYPFCSDAGSVNLMLTIIIAIRCGIMERTIDKHVED